MAEVIRKMSNLTAKVSSNVFYKARQRASEHNERLKSRENEADIMSIDRGRLYRIESGVAVPYPEEIKMMCDLYGMPELQNYYCTEMCPLGCDIPKISAVTLDRVAIHALSVFQNISNTSKILLDVAKDGQITEDEYPDMVKVLEVVKEPETAAQNLKVWAKKNL